MLGVQSANLAVHGFSTDQAYLRLQAELPRFRQPIAVVTVFMTALFGRNTDDERPRSVRGSNGRRPPRIPGWHRSRDSWCRTEPARPSSTGSR